MSAVDKNTKVLLDPFGTTMVEDYDHLCKEFGIEYFKPLLSKVPNSNMLMRRGIIFGHRDFERILEAMIKHEEFAVLSGIKPTGQFHLGTLMTAKEIVYFQKQGGTTFYCIADIEAYEDNRIPLERSEKYAVENVADILALGLDSKNAYIYRQMKETRVKDLAIMFGRALTLATAKAIYGKRHIGLYLSALIQAGDILLPQLRDFGGPKPTVVPVGVDQDPHLRLTRDLAQKFQRKYKFIPPSATYHKLMKGLTGSAKMSKREAADSLLTLNESPEKISHKISNAFTGGKATIAEQRKLGGIPEICPIYDICMFHFIEKDEDIIKIYNECRNGTLLCGEHKKQTIDIVLDFVNEHQRKRRKFIDKARAILGVM
ncbi:MAG: tryptophan--tRNA ligase [Candidatus Bathyarchaeota archaeon]|nr:MAG: tryptophan--tRNA ligase [Candidatus Bathyarchaeota archaeon]